MRALVARWPEWVTYVAIGWSLLIGLLGVVWALGGPGYPYGRGHDVQFYESNLGELEPTTGGWAFAVLGLSGAIIGVLTIRTKKRHLLLLSYGWLLAVVFLMVVPDRRLLMLTAYGPILLCLGIWSVVTGTAMPDVAEQAWWTLGNQLWSVLGGLLWLGATAAYVLRTRVGTPRWSQPAVAHRWGRWAVGVAVTMPLIYAATRWAWTLGLRLGISEEFYQGGASEGMWWAGAALASLAVGGSILTLGLVQRWGEVYPRLIWWRGGRRVPPMLAVVPASVVSIFVTAAGVAYWRTFVTSALPLEATWATMGPELFWPVWGVALAAATLAYHLHRRTEPTSRPETKPGRLEDRALPLQ